MTTGVEPRLYRGLRDLLPDQMAARQKMIDIIRGVYELYGFVPLGTPAIEHWDVLTGSVGDETTQAIFGVQNPENEKLGLRFDLTVLLARVVAQYRDLPKPFRRYQVAPVWRADKPDRGRFREFIQFDIDSVGVASEIADVEIIAAMCDTLTALEVGRYRVRFSSRKILGLLLEYAEVPEVLKVDLVRKPGANRESAETIDRPAVDVFRVLDKLEKIGPQKVRLELTKGYVDDSGDRIPGLHLTDAHVDRIERFLAIYGEHREDVLARLSDLFAKLPNAKAEIAVLHSISQRLADLGYCDDRVAIDLSIARGLAYYTGPVFEAVLLDAPQFGSVFAGGRYDDLVKRFLGEKMPATGASIGVDRLLAALVELGRIQLRPSTAQVLVTAIDPTLMNDYLKMTFELRRKGIRTELYLGSEQRIGKQIKHADTQQIPLVLMYGGDEKAKGVVTIKEMESGRNRAAYVAQRKEWLKERPGQIEVSIGELVPAIKKLLAELHA